MPATIISSEKLINTVKFIGLKIDVVKWAILTCLVFLAAAAIIGTRNIDRFYISSEQLLNNTMFLEDAKHWKVRGTGGVNYSLGTIEITNTKIENTIVSQRVQLESKGFHRLTFEGTTKSVSQGAAFADLATVAVIHRDQNGKFLGNKAAMRLHGTHSKQFFTLDMYLPEKVQSVDISARLLRSVGTLYVSNLSFSKTEEFESYKTFHWSIIIATALATMLLLAILAKTLDIRSWVFIITSIAVIGLGTQMPGNYVSETSRLLANSMPPFFWKITQQLLSLFYGDGQFSNNSTAVSKLGHIATFFFLGLVAALIRVRCGLFFTVTLLLYIAFATEAFQSLSLSRSSSLNDFYINTTCGLAGLSIGILFLLMGYAVNNLSAFWRD